MVIIIIITSLFDGDGKSAYNVQVKRRKKYNRFPCAKEILILIDISKLFFFFLHNSRNYSKSGNATRVVCEDVCVCMCVYVTL